MNTVPRYAVFGNPVAHSKSPQIHRQFALQEGVEIEYERICADIGGFAQAVEAFLPTAGAGRMLPYRSSRKRLPCRTNIPNALWRRVRSIR